MAGGTPASASRTELFGLVDSGHVLRRVLGFCASSLPWSRYPRSTGGQRGKRGQRGERASGGERCGRYNLGGKGRKRRFATLIR